MRRLLFTAFVAPYLSRTKYPITGLLALGRDLGLAGLQLDGQAANVRLCPRRAQEQRRRHHRQETQVPPHTSSHRRMPHWLHLRLCAG